MPVTAKIRSFHGLRGLMAWWVVIGHLSLALGWKLPIIDNNKLAVDVFIILSGFVIALLVVRKGESYVAYLIRRGFRIFPLYLLTLAISVLLLPVQLDAWRSLPANATNSVRITLANEALANLPFHLATHIPLLQGLVPNRLGQGAAYTVIGQAWSISLEWQFYLIAPLVLSLLIHRKWLFVIILVLLLSFLSRWFGDAFIGSKILLFLVGIGSYLSVHYHGSRIYLVVALLCGGLTILVDGFYQLVPLGIWSLVVISSICPLHSAGHVLARVLAAKIPYHLGEISYSVYLLHMIPLYGTAYLCLVNGFDGVISHFMIAISTIIVTYVLSLVTYLFVEKPCISAGAALTATLQPNHEEVDRGSLPVR
ncbi:acyltransferase family protein [Sphingomonas panni]|uniref:acyltransferase family protein n=1 Tax=Sphingomonas panni TaxID=237612 RepID=UPI002414343C|nr:acyltransferase [Sphingomonas panni]